MLITASPQRRLKSDKVFSQVLWAIDDCYLTDYSVEFNRSINIISHDLGDGNMIHGWGFFFLLLSSDVVQWNT